jgi:hypothetical protein
MTDEHHTDDKQPYRTPAIASREKIEALAVIGGGSDVKPPLCC